MLRLHFGSFVAIFQNFRPFTDQSLRDIVEQITQTECASPCDLNAFRSVISITRLLDHVTHHAVHGLQWNGGWFHILAPCGHSTSSACSASSASTSASSSTAAARFSSLAWSNAFCRSLAWFCTSSSWATSSSSSSAATSMGRSSWDAHLEFR